MIGVIDAGTTNIKLVVYDEGKIIYTKKFPVVKLNPRPNWIEIDARDLAKKCRQLADLAIEKYRVEAISLTNQRGTTVAWDPKNGELVHPALSWQDSRASNLANKLDASTKLKLGRALGKIVSKLSEVIPSLKNKRKAKWLIAVSKFSLNPSHMSVKLRWILDRVKNRKILAGGVDSWLLFNLVGENKTDFSNAAATGMYDIFYKKWSDTILDIIEVDRDVLPEILPSDSVFGEYRNTPVVGVLADQSASLYALGCWEAGSIKVTNGTGSFVDVNVGSEPAVSTMGLIPLVAWILKREERYMLEGIINYSGSSVELLKDLGICKDVKVTSEMAKLSKNDDILLIPSFAGLGTPYYLQVPGLIYGLSNATKPEDIVKALLEGLAFRVAEIVEIMRREVPIGDVIRCDGEMSSNDFFLQKIADITGMKIERGRILSGSSYGAYLVAGKAIGKWERGEAIEICETFVRKEDMRWKYDRWKEILSEYMGWWRWDSKIQRMQQ